MRSYQGYTSQSALEGEYHLTSGDPGAGREWWIRLGRHRGSFNIGVFILQPRQALSYGNSAHGAGGVKRRRVGIEANIFLKLSSMTLMVQGLQRTPIESRCGVDAALRMLRCAEKPRLVSFT